MDSVVNTAARALALGDALEALKRIALREDPPALALRGIAMAQLGDFAKARSLLRRAARAFGTAEPVARARCVIAQAEIALACRDLATAKSGFDAAERAAEVLAAKGDLANALLARLVSVRRLVLLGRLEEASLALASLALTQAPPRLVAIAELVTADIAIRGLHTRAARGALERAHEAARTADVPPLSAEVEHALRNLDAPAARLVADGTERVLRLEEVEALLGSGKFIVDACRREVRSGKLFVSLVTRPVLFALAVALAERVPMEMSRDALILRAFGARRANESHRARLRVEIGRLRKALLEVADVQATPNGFVLLPRRGKRAALLLPPDPGEASALVALLAGGDAWSTSGLAAALGKSQRTVQRALGALHAAGKVSAVGHGRARRWVTPPNSGFATTLLLVARGTLG